MSTLNVPCAINCDLPFCFCMFHIFPQQNKKNDHYYYVKEYLFSIQAHIQFNEEKRKLIK